MQILQINREIIEDIGYILKKRISGMIFFASFGFLKNLLDNLAVKYPMK